MFEILGGLAQAWREILHVSELTGLSIGALGALAAIVYFEPTIRTLAIRLAIGVVASYFAALYGYHLGGADMRAQWNAANLQAAAEAAARDIVIAKKLESDNPPPTAVEQKQASTDEAKLIADLTAAHSVSCQLGDEPLGLRNQRR